MYLLTILHAPIYVRGFDIFEGSDIIFFSLCKQK